ncbi:MAG TPA: signal peptide peptidase SppA [Bacteroidales bacterium]|nr:signal peptide peptidase SppA [Bacteroidales bacterium]
MKNFLITMLATITGIILVSIIFFFIMIGSLSVMIASGNKTVSVSDNSILVLKAGVQIPDRTDPNPFAGLDIINMTITPAPGLNDILNNIEKAEFDPKIKGILIENGLMPSGWATTEEIRNALLKFRKECGKFVISYSDYILEQEGYYLSTAANKIYISPSSMVDFKGLSGDVMFYKKALEKIGVEVQVTRHGKFKGAVEPYILDKLSDENKEQIKEYVGSIWNHVVKMMSEARGISGEKLNLLADKLAGNIASSALESGLVDGLLFRDELNDTLKVLSGLKIDDKIHFISMSRFSKVPDKINSVSMSQLDTAPGQSKPKTIKVGTSKNRIAVIYASGTIVMGKGTDYNIGGSRYADVIREVRLDTAVKAIVMRVNSPGGNAVASDIMWRELMLAAKAKPLVISMGNLAASGGYYISAPATKIYSSPTTISGSIGVFGMIPNAGKLLEQKLGITTESVKTNTNSDFPSIFRPMSIYEKQAMQASIEKIYSDFVSKVAAGRKMTASSVDSIGQGRVWSGSNAMKIGLIDEMGGLTDAIKGAAVLAGIDSYSVTELPEADDPYTRILTQLGGEIRMNLIKKELGETFRFYNEITEIKDMSGIQARLPYFIEIH